MKKVLWRIVLQHRRKRISFATLLFCASVFSSTIILQNCNTPLSASMQDNLEKAFQTLGLAHNVTEGGGYQDQTGGFYTGGRVFARSKVNNADLLSLQLPHYRAGCGGLISLWAALAISMPNNLSHSFGILEVMRVDMPLIWPWQP